MYRRMDKKLTVNDLRHLFITPHIKSDSVTHAERAEIASSKMYSPTVQLEYMHIYTSYTLAPSVQGHTRERPSGLQFGLD